MITVPERIDFAKIPQVVDIPHLLEVQLASYERFLQRSVPMDKRESHRSRIGVPLRFSRGLGAGRVHARISRVLHRRAEVRRRGMQGARSHVRGSPQGGAPARRAREPGRRAGYQGHHPERGVSRRDPPDYRHGDVHHQRRRAGDREPAPPFSGRRLRRRLSTRTASGSSTPASSRTADRGSNSRST